MNGREALREAATRTARGEAKGAPGRLCEIEMRGIHFRAFIVIHQPITDARHRNFLVDSLG